MTLSRVNDDRLRRHLDAVLKPEASAQLLDCALDVRGDISELPDVREQVGERLY
jgi:hypothetical protein